jgi:hypothetical protein
MTQHTGKDAASAACDARVDIEGERVAYCMLEAGHDASGSLHRSAIGINWCCNGKTAHSEDCVRRIPVPSVVN